MGIILELLLWYGGSVAYQHQTRASSSQMVSVN